MAGKRKKAPAATAGGNPQRRKSTSSLKSEAAASDAGATEDTQADSALLFETEKFMVLNPWCSDVLSLFDALWDQHGEPVAILRDIIGGDGKEAKQEWAGFLANTFPPDREILYMTTWDGFPPADSSDLSLCFLSYHLMWMRATRVSCIVSLSWQRVSGATPRSQAYLGLGIHGILIVKRDC